MKRLIYNTLLSAILLIGLGTATPCQATATTATPQEEIVIENSTMTLTLSPDGYATSLRCKATGEECLLTTEHTPLCALTQYRPYDNENFLMFPAKPRVFPSNHIERVGDELHVEFQDTYDIAIIELRIEEQYIGFELKRIDYRIEDFGVKRKTEIDELTMLQLPVRQREHFGEWLNVLWDDKTAVAVMGTHPTTRIDAYDRTGGKTMVAGMEHAVKLFNSGAALVAAPKERFLDAVEAMERDYQMPAGVASRRHEAYRCSYYELRDVTTANIDEHIENARRGGFKTIVVYYWDFTTSCGHYLWKDSYPNQIEDLKVVTGKIRAAGMIPGFHIHYSKVSVTDPYICGGVPDTRLNSVRELILAEPLAADATEIVVEGNPEGMRMEEGRRIVQIGNELISFTDYTTEAPYRLTGCKRGLHNSTPAAYPRGTHFRHLDVDDWPYFIRVDQNTGLQAEIAERLATLYHEAGFEFVYFDGAEDVPMPYWYNVSRAQYEVYKRLNPAPLFSEGALKSHYGWHILTRGNAFDHFPPERIRPAYQKYTLRCARQIANDFTSVNFGWTDYIAPSEKSIGMQPDMFEYIYSKALAWEAPVSVMGRLDQIRQHPRSEDNFEVMRGWERVKLGDMLTAEQKEMLKEPTAEHLLLFDREGRPEVLPYRQLTGDTEEPIRAFQFERGGKQCIIYWHVSGSGILEFDAAGTTLRLTDTSGRKVAAKRSGSRYTLPAGGRLIVESSLPAEELERRFMEAVAKVNHEIKKPATEKK